MVQNGFNQLNIDPNRKLPIGIQSFEKLITDGFLYVDKTQYVYELVHYNVPYFLSRPRRFGKSLLLSTLRAYWEGKKELFQGLQIEMLEQNNPVAWEVYPVFYFDFNRGSYAKMGDLELVLEAHIREWEQIYGCVTEDTSLAVRFQNLLVSARTQTGKRCVILVDEYDKSLLDTMYNSDLTEHNKDLFKGFFSVLKSYDAYIQFAMITGVTKFSKVSIFSDLNNLMDISMNRRYSGICGISEEELEQCFQPEIAALARVNTISPDQCRDKLKSTYDGYRFHPNGTGVYNPYSLLNALFDHGFRYYWFSTGTPTFLARRLREIHYDIRQFQDRTLYADADSLSDYRADNTDPVPLLYQTGYLTILSGDDISGELLLGFPNEEVKYGFLRSLMTAYINTTGGSSGKDILSLRRYLENGETERIHEALTALFASIPYTTNDAPFEHYFQTVLFVVFTLLGEFVQCEQHTYKGRIDCIVETDKYIYLFEFKRDESAESALRQIDERGYALPYAADTRKLYRIGVNFDSDTRMLDDWKVQE